MKLLILWLLNALFLKKIYLGATGEIAQQQRSLKIQEYESAMNRLQLITGKSDVEQMTRYYKRNEDDNFTMFKYVTELNNQVKNNNN